MKMYRPLLIVMIGLVSLGAGENEGLAPPPGDTVYQSLTVGTKATLNCSKSADLSGMTVTEWQVPDDQFGHVKIQTGGLWNFIKVSSDGKVAEISKVLLEHEGQYRCFVKSPSSQLSYHLTEVTVNARPTTEVYFLNIIIGVLAAGVFFIIAIVVFALYNCRWEARHRRSDTKPMMAETVATSVDAEPPAHSHTTDKQPLDEEPIKVSYIRDPEKVDVENPSYDDKNQVYLDTKM